LTFRDRASPVCRFFGYWEDIGTIKSFFEENLKLCRQPAEFE
jgi:glucose-1-phosphate adenylyltransferase